MTTGGGNDYLGHQESGWSVETLRVHIREIMEERERRFSEALREKDKRDEQRYLTQQEGIDRTQAATEKAVQVALAAADRAIGKAEDTSERRLDILNEFRRTVEDLVKQAPTRMELDPKFITLADRITAFIKDSRDADDRLREEHQRDMVTIRDELQKAVRPLAQMQDVNAGWAGGVEKLWSVILSGLAAAIAIAAFLR